MAAPSIAALFPNPQQASSAKPRQYTLRELKIIVARSGAPHAVVAATLAALTARGKWPNQDGPATTVLSVSLLGMMLDSTAGCCRSTAQRRIKRAVKDGYWRRLHNANSWTNCPKCGKERKGSKCESCPYRGRSKDESGKWTGEFMRVPTYEFDLEKFRHAPRCRELRQFDARTYAEHKAAAQRGEHPNVTDISSCKLAQPAPEPPPPKSPAPARPVEEPVRKTAEHQRAVGRALGPAQRRELADRINAYEQGNTVERDVNGYMVRALEPGHFHYIKPLPRPAAVLAACESMDRGDQKWRFEALRIPKQRAIEAAIEMGEVIPTGGILGST